jgi:probable F420-dependent oxidoreductase
LLARDLASVDALTGGRLEIGLGAGYVESEFIAAGLPLPSGGERVRLLTEHVTTIRGSLSNPEFAPGLVQTPPPILVAGSGDRLLAMAAKHADIVSIMSMGTEGDLAERVAYVKEQAGDRIDQIELAFGFFQVSMDDSDDLSMLRRMAPDAADASLRSLATLLDGPVAVAAERIQRLHEELGIGYFTLTKTDGTSWDTLAKLVAAIRD